MTWNRREVLQGLGLAGAHLLAFGCGVPAQTARPRYELSGEVRTWLRDAVAMIHGAGFTGHALAVSRRHTAAVQDVLGAGVGHARADGVVLALTDKTGRREQATSELTRDGVMNAVRALVGNPAPARIDFGPPPAPARVPDPDPDHLDDTMLLDRLATVERRESGLSSRIVYAANLLELDDAMVWSVARGRDQEQRLFRVRRQVTRVAWNGTRPIISEVSRAWTGGLDDQTFSDEELAQARDVALSLMTPGAFDDGEHAVVLAPEVTAAIVDTAARSLLTATARRRPDVAARLAMPQIASPHLTLVDDPSVPHAYGGFEFDDDGEPPTPVTLIDRGVVGTALARARRPGHSGPREILPSHLVVRPGTAVAPLSPGDGYVLEGHRGVSIDAASDRCVIAVQRAVEVRKGRATGRQFADIELVGTTTALLGSVGEATATSKVIGLRADSRDGLPRWRSIHAPWLAAKGMLRARRRSA